MATIILCNMGRVPELAEERDLALENVDFVLGSVKVDYFESDDVSTRDMNALVHGSVSTLTDRFQASV
jgi:hypothetical protein